MSICSNIDLFVDFNFFTFTQEGFRKISNVEQT